MNFNELVKVIVETHQHFAGKARKSINMALTYRNWLFGYYIQEFELGGKDRAEYGAKLIESLSKQLQKANVPSASHRSLKVFRQFYLTYPQIGQTVSAQFDLVDSPRGSAIQKSIRQISSAQLTKAASKDLMIPPEVAVQNLSFSQFIELMKIDDPLKRVFYELETINSHWSLNELKRQVGSLYYERSALSKNKKKLAELVRSQPLLKEPNDIIRDPYVFEFLGLQPSEILLENDLRDILILKLQDFMLELGKGFCYEARNKRILIGDDYFFVDLVFYHRILKCHVLLELKLKSFDHVNIGQLNAYLNYYKKHEMQEGDNPPVGILLCTDKNRALVEYSLEGINNQLFVSRYQLGLPTKEEIQVFLEQELKKDFLAK